MLVPTPHLIVDCASLAARRQQHNHLPSRSDQVSVVRGELSGVTVWSTTTQYSQIWSWRTSAPRKVSLCSPQPTVRQNQQKWAVGRGSFSRFGLILENSACQIGLKLFLSSFVIIKILFCFQDIPQQMNGSDCGMFSCKFAEYLSRNASITFTQEHMPYFRRRMVYEIVTQRLM